MGVLEAVTYLTLVITPVLRVHYPQGQEVTAQALGSVVREAVEEFPARVAVDLDPASPVNVYLGTTDAEYDRLGQTYGGAPPRGWSLATAYPSRGVVVVRMGSVDVLGSNNARTTLRHEVAHLFIHQLERRGGQRVPLWLNEGLAEWLSGRRLSPDERNRLRVAARGGTLIPFDTLVSRMPPHDDDVALAYLQALGFVEFLVSRSGEGAVTDLCRWLALGDSVHNAFRNAVDAAPGALESAWVDGLERGYSLVWDLIFRVNVIMVCSLLAVIAYVRMRRVRKRRLDALAE